MGIIVALLRLISLVLIAGALMALGYDAFTWWGDHSHQLTSVVGVADLTGQKSLFAGWPGFAQTILAFPAFLVLGTVGILLAVISKLLYRD